MSCIWLKTCDDFDNPLKCRPAFFECKKQDVIPFPSIVPNV